MSEAAESPGAEVRQGKKRRWKNWYVLIPVLFFPCSAAISLFVGMGIFAMIGVLDDANVGRARGDIKTLETNMARFKTTTGKAPKSLEDFVRGPENFTGSWKPLMPKAALIDPWGEPYQYRKPGLKNTTGYDLFSKGPDKKEGTNDDIGHW
jgi:general secretion pathway protein G